jgi:hypothetical protein
MAISEVSGDLIEEVCGLGVELFVVCVFGAMKRCRSAARGLQDASLVQALRTYALVALIPQLTSKALTLDHVDNVR